MTPDELDNRAVILNRVSSLRQEDGFSLDAQNELNIEYCARKNLQVVQTFTFSESAGPKRIRKEFMSVLDFLRKHQVMHLVVEKTDRLLRNFYDYIKIEEMMQEHGLHIHFPKEGSIIHKSSNSHEKQVFGFKVLIAKGFLDNLSEETRKGLRKKVENGGYPIRAPYGYSHDLTQKRLNAKFPEADTIKDIFERYTTQDISVDDLADQLNSDGIRPPRGMVWYGSTIHKMLNNPVYFGDVRWKGKIFKGTHEALVAFDTWQCVQEKMRIRGGPKQKRRYLFAGFVRLPNGRMFTGELQKSRVYYGAWLNEKGKKGGKLYIREDRLQTLLDTEFCRFGWSQLFYDSVVALARSIVRDEEELVRKNVSSFQNQLDQLNLKKQRLLNLYVDAELDRTAYLTKMAELARNETFLTSRLTAFQHDSEALTNKVKSIVHDFLEIDQNYERSRVARKVRIMRAMCEEAVIEKDLKVSLKFKETYRPFITDEITQNCRTGNPVLIQTLLRPLGESNPCCGNENPES
jgi:site-specific DNA recombinase